MKHGFFKSIMSSILALAMLMSMTGMAFATESAELDVDYNNWEAQVKEQMEAIVEEEGGVILASSDQNIRASTHPIFENFAGSFSASDFLQYSYSISDAYDYGAYKIIWACGGDNWQSTQSTFRAETSSGQNTLLYAKGSSFQTYTLNNTNSWNYVWHGTWNLTIKPYSQCYGTYNYVFTFYIVPRA